VKMFNPRDFPLFIGCVDRFAPFGCHHVLINWLRHVGLRCSRLKALDSSFRLPMLCVSHTSSPRR
jgi:hypothetical protein